VRGRGAKGSRGRTIACNHIEIGIEIEIAATDPEHDFDLDFDFDPEPAGCAFGSDF
jgi:hypothetical protein